MYRVRQCPEFDCFMGTFSPLALQITVSDQQMRPFIYGSYSCVGENNYGKESTTVYLREAGKYYRDRYVFTGDRGISNSPYSYIGQFPGKSKRPSERHKTLPAHIFSSVINQGQI